MRKLVIDRSIWLHGEGKGDSYLLRRRDGKMCCLGIYLDACGVSKDLLLSLRMPSFLEVIPLEAEWLINDEDGRARSSEDVFELAILNDTRAVDDRENKIAEVFKKNDVEVEFVGEVKK